MGIIWEKSFIIFLFITLILGGGAAWMTGRALARGWAPFWQAALYMLLLGAAVRFFHYGLFAPPREGTLLSLHYYAVDTAILIALAWLGYQSTRATQMATQYGWLYRKTSPLTWTAK
ncbi:MAG: hypothetical protein GC150_08230 [Rhizobiales bacterium]|nr:hypothetical protein [Hyphomicrobiales bacterium]